MTDMSVVESIFVKAVEQAPAERAAFLDDECPDAETRREVERLLAAHPEAKSFLQKPAVDLGATRDSSIKERAGS